MFDLLRPKSELYLRQSAFSKRIEKLGRANCNPCRTRGNLHFRPPLDPALGVTLRGRTRDLTPLCQTEIDKLERSASVQLREDLLSLRVPHTQNLAVLAVLLRTLPKLIVATASSFLRCHGIPLSYAQQGNMNFLTLSVNPACPNEILHIR